MDCPSWPVCFSFLTPTALIKEHNVQTRSWLSVCSCNGALIIQAVWVFHKLMQSVSHKQQTGTRVQQLHLAHRQFWMNLSEIWSAVVIFTLLSFDPRRAALHWSSTVKLLLTEDMMEGNMTLWTKLTYSRMSILGLLGLFLFILKPLYLWLIKLTSNITGGVCDFFCVCVCLWSEDSVCALTVLSIHNFSAGPNPPRRLQSLWLFTEILFSMKVHQISHSLHLCWSKAVIY